MIITNQHLLSQFVCLVKIFNEFFYLIPGVSIFDSLSCSEGLFCDSIRIHGFVRIRRSSSRSLDPQLDEDCKIQQARHFLEIIENGKGNNISLTKTQKLCQ